MCKQQVCAKYNLLVFWGLENLAFVVGAVVGAKGGGIGEQGVVEVRG